MAWDKNYPEISEAADRFVDYCLWDYKPLTPVDKKNRSINLLYHSFQVARADERLFELCETIRSAIGSFKTVWGTKFINGKLSWEFYFYDYARLEREVSITRLLEVIKPYVSCELKANELTPYFMFSIDLDKHLLTETKKMQSLSVYVGNMGCAVSSGISYTLTQDELLFDNLYYFFDPKKEWESIVGKVASSAYLDLPSLNIDEIIWPEMVDCGCIVVANKRRNDGIYFSRISLGQLLFFLKRCAYPVELISYIEANANKLDHLLYDVGMDYRMENGRIKILKSSYYGFF